VRRPVKLGVAVSLSGRYALLGRQAVEGVKLYAADANRRGGIRIGAQKLPLEVVAVDDQGSESAVRKAVEKLVRVEQVELLFGPYGSGLTLAAAEVADSLSHVLWNHGGASDEITRRYFSWSVSVPTPASRYLPPVLDLVRSIDPGAKRVGVVHSATGFAGEVASGALRGIDERGLALVLHRTYASGTEDFGAILREIAMDTPDVFVAAGRLEDDIHFATQLAALQPRVRAAALVAAAVTHFRHALGERSEGFLGPSQWEPEARYPVDFGPTATEFAERYRAATGAPPDYPAAQAYAAGLIAERAAAEAGSLEQKALREAASRMRLTTFFGPFAIDSATGAQEAHTMLVTQWQRGVKRIVWPKEVADGQLVLSEAHHD
jgi:branched-chain amino acid transport system substrate-binding protein